MSSLKTVVHIEDYNLEITFEDGTKKILDFEPRLKQFSNYKPYLQIEKFLQFKIENGTRLYWPGNVLDFHSNHLYETDKFEIKSNSSNLNNPIKPKKSVIRAARKKMDDIASTVKKVKKKEGYYIDDQLVKLQAYFAYHYFKIILQHLFYCYQLPAGTTVKDFFYYQNNLRAINPKLIKHFETAYNELYLNVYRRGDMKAKSLKIGMEEYGYFLHFLEKM